MRASDTMRWGVRGIRQRKLRAFLTILGIMIGTAAIVALTSQTAGIQGSILGQINKLGSNTITIRPASGTTILTPSDVNKIAQIPGVVNVIPEVTASVKVYGVGGVKTFSLIGIDPAQFDEVISGVKFTSGRLYQPLSYSEVIIGQNVHYPATLTTAFLNPGQSATLEIGVANPVRTEVQVVGSLDTYGMSTAASVDDSVFISIKGAMTILGRNNYNAIFVKTSTSENVDNVVVYLKALYGNTISITTVKQITEIVSTITGMLSVLLGAIAGISLFVAGVGIMNIMFVSVMERTKEIGVLKALGFKKNDVLSIFLSEASILGIMGGISGILLGVGLSFLMPVLLTSGFSSGAAGSSFGSSGTGFGPSSAASGMSNFSYSPVFNTETIVFVFLFAVVISIVAGFYPARRASKMDPVVALRHE